MKKIFIAFKYKLTAIITLIILLLLVAMFVMVQSDIEKRFRVLIDEQLIQAKDYVSQRMDDRYDLLYNDVTAVVYDKLIHDVITDRNLNMLTRNDIVTAEVLPKFVNLEVLIVTDPNGNVIAEQGGMSDLSAELINTEWFEYAKEGEEVGGYILSAGQFYQGVAMPVFLGEGMVGLAIGARVLDQEDLALIKKVSNIDVALLHQSKRIAATEFSGISDSQTLVNAFDSWLQSEPVASESTLELQLGEERFMLQWVVDETLFVPPYIIVRSLDESLQFVAYIRQTMTVLGSVGMILALLAAFAFAVSISSPIKRLATATTHVAREDFEHKVEIKSRDEFSLLGDSFNQMISDLAEKRKIRAAFDKSVSKEVADHMLAQGAQLGGSREFATVLFADIRGFTTLAESLDERSLINLLNQYFSQVNICIEKRKGVIDKFIGDAVMALFGTPLPCEQSAYSALMASHSMLATVETFNQHCSIIYGCEIRIGIGLNSGHVVAGLVGAENRLNFTVLGDQVNIASRIEGLCKYYGVELVMSKSCVDEVVKSREVWEQNIVFRQLDCVRVKGKSTGLNIYQPFFDPSEAELGFIEQFEQGLLSVLLGELAKAKSILEPLQQQWPDDQPTIRLLKLVERYLGDQQSYQRDYRDGVRIATQK